MEMNLLTVGLILIFIGFALAFISVFLMSFGGVKSIKKARGGGIVMIGPIPIIFGTDKESLKVLMILGIVLMVIAFVFMFILNRFL